MVKNVTSGSHAGGGAKIQKSRNGNSPESEHGGELEMSADGLVSVNAIDYIRKKLSGGEHGHLVNLALQGNGVGNDDFLEGTFFNPFDGFA